MTAPSWVPVVAGNPVQVWLDFRSAQFWNQDFGGIVSLISQIQDAQGQTLTLTPGVGIEPYGSPSGSGLPSAQLGSNPTSPPNFAAPTKSNVLNALNTYDAAGGYTIVVGFIIKTPQNGNPFAVELGGPWQNPNTSNFSFLQLSAEDTPFPNYTLQVALELVSKSFFFSANDTNHYPLNSVLNIQFSIDELSPSFTYSFNGDTLQGPVSLPEAFNAENIMDFLYLGNEANSVDGITQAGVRPMGALQYFALIHPPVSGALVNFPDNFIPPPSPVKSTLPFTTLIPIPRNPGLWR